MENPILAAIKGQSGEIIGITGSPSTTIEIAIDIKEESKLGRVLGQMVYFSLEEEGNDILVIGQVTSIETQNRWHQDPSFKGVIRLHGSLPHLSGRADNRIASISVQAAYLLGGEKDAKGHILGTSPSTGIGVKKMSNAVMSALMKQHEKEITYLGKVYGTDVDMPFWFRHFDKGEGGAGDAHHIGVFGKSGSGKSVAAAYVLLGYAKNKERMNILVLDPQGQFYSGQDFPQGFDLENNVKKVGMNFERHHILDDLYLPGTGEYEHYKLFASLLQKNKFIQRAFNIMSDRENEAATAIADYLFARNQLSKGKEANLNSLDENGSRQLLKQLLEKFIERPEAAPEDPEKPKKKGKKSPEHNRYVSSIYSSSARIEQLLAQIEGLLGDQSILDTVFLGQWHPIVQYFAPKKNDGTQKSSLKSIINKVTSEKNKGNFVVLNISGEKRKLDSENIKALFVRIISNEIKNAGEELYAEGKKVNCLVVMDEAHRYISYDSSDPQIIELTKEIVDSVRTTRKYGIGYMFITQTIESLDKEVLQQIRIFAFGYGLTIGTELRTISNLVNNESAIQLYKSFVDPSSSHKFPFMFFGSVSPLSFTGSPLFIEVYNDPKEFR